MVVLDVDFVVVIGVWIDIEIVCFCLYVGCVFCLVDYFIGFV